MGVLRWDCRSGNVPFIDLPAVLSFKSTLYSQLMTSAYRTVTDIYTLRSPSVQVFQYVMEIATMLSASSSHSEQALKIFLCAAQVLCCTALHCTVLYCTALSAECTCAVLVWALSKYLMTVCAMSKLVRPLSDSID
jgi:hypothetical protein